MVTSEEEPVGGGVGSRSGDFVAVRKTPVVVGVAVLTALLLQLAYMWSPLPRSVAHAFGVKQGQLARDGGLFLSWSPPPGFDDTKLDRTLESLRVRAAATGGEVIRDGDTFRIAIAGVKPREIEATTARITGGPSDGQVHEGLAFREVLQIDAMKQLADLEPELRVPHASPSLEVDQWRPEEGPQNTVTDYYLAGPSLDAIKNVIAHAMQSGWKLPDGAMIAYEKLQPTDVAPGGYRSYVVRVAPELDGSYVANAVKTYDPNTNRPTVLLDFDREGAQRFGDATARLVGKKLAIMVNGEVRSAPVLNGAIRGGRASIAMGAGSPEQQERDADDLAEALRQGGGLPAGGRVTDSHYIPPDQSPGRAWLARLVIALVGGGLIGLVTWLVLGWVAPVRRTASSTRPVNGPLAWPRVVATLAAPASMLIVSKVPIYGVNLRSDGSFLGMFNEVPKLTIGALGIMPVITAAIIVELVALAIPTWRRRRHAGPVARFPITLASAVTAVLLIVIQGWSVAQYLGAVEGTMDPGLMPKILVVASVAGGTMILIAAAAIVRMYGLGNGYGALFASGWLFSMLEHLRGGRLLSTQHVIGALGAVIIAAAFAVALRWRVQRNGELGLRVPVSSITPLSDAGGLVAFIALIAQFSFDEVMVKLVEWISHLREHPWMLLVLVIVLAIAWSLAFGRPSRYAGLARPSWPVWARATTLAVLLLTFVAAIVAFTLYVRPGVVWWVEPLTIAVTVAYVFDAYEDLRARRTKLVVVWTLHQPHHVDAAQAVLAEAGIPAHMSSSNLRTLLAFFGPFVPIEVQVPPDHALAARDMLESLATSRTGA